MKLPNVDRYLLDMCCYNLTSSDKLGTGVVKKTTAILTNSPIIGKFLARKCSGGHRHVRLWGGRKATAAATYSPDFCEAIVEGYKLHIADQRRRAGQGQQRGSLKARDKMDSDIHEVSLLEDDEEDLPGIDELLDIYLNGQEALHSDNNQHDHHSGCMSINLWPQWGVGATGVEPDALDKIDKQPDENEDDLIAWDDVKNRPLCPKGVKKARATEMGYVFQHGVYTYASVDECRRVTGAAPIGTRWLDKQG